LFASAATQIDGETIRDMNVLAGLAIGLVNDTWFATLIASVVWPFIYCAFVSIARADRARVTIADFRARGRHFLFGSPAATFYSIEFVTALFTALPVALIAHLLRRIFT